MGNSTRKPCRTPEVGEEKEQQVNRSLARLSTVNDLEASARYCGALRRRREIQSAEILLRYVMVYALTPFSLRMVGAWGTLQELGSLCKNGVRKRLCQCQTWLGYLIMQLLIQGNLTLTQRKETRVRLFDATTVSQPGSHTADWRLQLGVDLGSGRITDIALTTSKIGESLTTWQFNKNEINIADRYSANARSLGVVLGAAASCVIRLGWSNLPLRDAEGQAFCLPTWLKVLSTDPAATPAQVYMWVQTPQGHFRVRVIARAIPPDKAEQAREKLRKEAKRKKKKLDERSLIAAGFVMVVTNLPEATWTAADILSLYRFRWQIELVFKRLKSILTFDHLRATDPGLAQVYLLTKLLIALLLTEAEWRLTLAEPALFFHSNRPISRWRLTQLTLESFRQSVLGPITWQSILDHLPALARYLADDPRRRQSQLTALHIMGMVYGF